MNVAGKESIRERMPLLARHEGVWEGWFRHYDTATGLLVDQHRSRLICRLPDEGQHKGAYHQTNFYFWEDGRRETRDFPSRYINGRIWFDNGLIEGWAAAMEPDDLSRSTCLHWTRHDDPGQYLYEMMQLSADNKSRSRIWQWFKDDRCFQRTLIDETFVTADWKSWSSRDVPDN